MKKKNNCTRSLQQQAFTKLKNMESYGRSKSKDKKKGETKDKIYSFSTFKTYWKHIKYFVKYVRDKHPECKNINEARQYVNEWLKTREDSNLSAWTVTTEAKALGKLYQIEPDDPDYFRPPTRYLEDIKRSRHKDKNARKYFSEENNRELVHFCKMTGLRRAGLTSLKNDCLRTKNDIEKELSDIGGDKSVKNKENRLKALNDALRFKENNFIEVTEKGGKLRYVPILNDDEEVIKKIKSTPDYLRVWPHVSKNCDVHGYRREYANSIYNEYTTDPSGKKPFYNDDNNKKHYTFYYKRGENRNNTKLDRKAMYMASLALGHNRINVVADNYM